VSLCSIHGRVGRIQNSKVYTTLADWMLYMNA